MSKKPSREEKTLRLAMDRLMLFDEFKHKSGELNALLQDFDLHGVASDSERQEFWERYAVEGAGLIHLFGAISKLQGGGGQDRILRFFQHHVGEVVEGIALYAVSGISEYGKRVRELRDMGWDISSHHHDPMLRAGQYRLESLEQNLKKAGSYEEKQKRKKQGSTPEKPGLRLV